MHISQLANETGDVEKAICNQIQANLGVKCTVDIYKDFGTLQVAQQNGEVPDGTLVGSGWIADNPTIQNMVTANFTCDQLNNFIGYCNKDGRQAAAGGHAGQGRRHADLEVAGGREADPDRLLRVAVPDAEQRRCVLDPRQQRVDQPGWVRGPREDLGQPVTLVDRIG